MRKLLFKCLRKTAKLLGGGSLHRLNSVARSPLVSSLYKKAFKTLRPKEVLIDGHHMFLDKNDTLFLTQGATHERMVIDQFKKRIKKGHTVVDLGANIGYHTLIAARLVGPKGKVYAFEPDPENFSILKKNVRANGYKNVVLVNKAAGNTRKKIKLYLAEHNLGDHKLFDAGEERSFVEVDMVKVDDVVKNNKVNFIKMDIQGAEILALKGMKKICAKNDLTCVCEFQPTDLEGLGGSGKEFLDLLKTYGFAFYNIDDKIQRVTKTTAAKLLKKYKKGHTNLLCVKD